MLKDLPACFFEFLTSAWRTPWPTKMSARTTAHYVYCIPVESPTSSQKEEHHSLTGYYYIFLRFRQTDPSVVENTVRKKDFSLIGVAAFYLHEHLFCVAPGERV